MTSERMRDNPLFMRNEFATVGRWEIPLIHKHPLDTANIKLVACSDTRSNDRPENTQKGVHFFVDDYRFSGVYDNPERFHQMMGMLTDDLLAYYRLLEENHAHDIAAHPAQLVSLLRGLIVILPAAFILCALWQEIGVWLAFPVTEALVCAVAACFWAKYARPRAQKK